MKSKLILFVIIFCGVVSLKMSSAKAQQLPEPRVQVFPLANVRLLDSPFKQRMKANEKYILSLDANRVLAPYYKAAGIRHRGRNYGGWESSALAGAFGGQYLAGLSLMYAATGNEKLKERADYFVKQLGKIQKKTGTGYVGGVPHSKKLWSKVKQGIIHASRFSLDSVWSPWYNLHMTFRGLRTAWKYAGNNQARQIMIKFGDWVVDLSNQLSDQQFAKMIKSECNGMNQVMANLYAMTGKEKYLKVAKRFNDPTGLFESLANGEDKLAGHHVNFTIPVMIGAARQYELDGDPRLAKVAKYFFKEVTGKRIYVNGEMGPGEYFSKLGTLPEHLSKATGETDNVFNMLRLAEHLIQWNPENMNYIRYYERAIYNDMLASQDPQTGQVCYFLSMKPGFFKTFSTPTESFWCCVGGGVQNHARYGKLIYMHNNKQLYINLFIPSVLTWKEKGITLTQRTQFPRSQKSTLHLQMDHPQKLTLEIRHPWWAKSGFVIKVNGQEINHTGSPGNYTAVSREWHDGDTITLSLPEQLHVERMQNAPQKAAIMYGPVVLAGELGGYVPFPYAKSNGDFFDMPAISVPKLAVGQHPVKQWIKPVPGKPLHFKTVGVGQPKDVELAPLYEITHQHYTVYWNLLAAK